MTEKSSDKSSEHCPRVLETLPCSSILDDLGVKASMTESDKRPIVYGNPVAQKFTQLVYNHVMVSHEDENPITETAKVLKLSETTVYKYKDGSGESEIPLVKRKHKKLQTIDSRECVKQTIRLEIYKIYTESQHKLRCC